MAPLPNTTTSLKFFPTLGSPHFSDSVSALWSGAESGTQTFEAAPAPEPGAKTISEPGAGALRSRERNNQRNQLFTLGINNKAKTFWPLALGSGLWVFNYFSILSPNFFNFLGFVEGSGLLDILEKKKWKRNCKEVLRSSSGAASGLRSGILKRSGASSTAPAKCRALFQLFFWPICARVHVFVNIGYAQDVLKYKRFLAPSPFHIFKKTSPAMIAILLAKYWKSAKNCRSR